MLVRERTQARNRDIRVLVTAEQVLQAHQAPGRRLRRDRVEVAEELQRVAELLRLDPKAVVVAGFRVWPQLLGGLAQRLHTSFDQHRGDVAGGYLAGCPGLGQRAQDAGEAVDERLVTWRVESIEHPRPGFGPLRGEHLHEPSERSSVLGSERRAPPLELVELHIQVADGAEEAADPSELLSQRRDLRRQHFEEQRESCPEPAAGDTHGVQALGVLAEPRTRLFLEQRRKLSTQSHRGDGPDRRLLVELGRPEVRRLDLRQPGRQEPGFVLGQVGGP